MAVLLLCDDGAGELAESAAQPPPLESRGPSSSFGCLQICGLWVTGSPLLEERSVFSVFSEVLRRSAVGAACPYHLTIREAPYQ